MLMLVFNKSNNMQIIDHLEESLCISNGFRVATINLAVLNLKKKKKTDLALVSIFNQCFPTIKKVVVFNFYQTLN